AGAGRALARSQDRRPAPARGAHPGMTGARPRRIDAHQHFWRLARGDYGWLKPELGTLYRDFEPADLAPLLARGGIDATIAVQAAPSAAETRHLLALARATPWIAGVVGWLDFESPRALEEL